MCDGANSTPNNESPRQGWEEAAREMHSRDEDLLLDPPAPTHFDEQEWQW